MNTLTVTDLHHELQALSIELRYIASLMEAAQREIRYLVDKGASHDTR